MSSTTAAQIRQASRQRSAADHAGTIRSFYPFWDAQYRPMLIHAVEAFPPEHLGFKPRPEMLTAQQMILHIAEAERGWIDNIVGGGPAQEWVEPAADPAQGWRDTYGAPDHATLLALLEEWHRPTQKLFDLPASELSRVVTYKPEDGEERRYTLHWILDHVQEHEIHHRGQLNLYLRLLGITPPSI